MSQRETGPGLAASEMRKRTLTPTADATVP